MRHIITILALLAAIHATAQTNIWEGTTCGKHVELTPYLAEGDNNMAIIVCPGGSYFWHDMNAEGRQVAQWLQRNGISAFILRYRSAQTPAFLLRYRHIFRGVRYPDALDDLRQAMRHVRSHAADYHINPSCLGVMGFSAGGHLVLSGAELLPPADKPQFAAAIYPVVTMSAQCTHKRSRRALMGESRVHDKALRDSLSMEKRVDSSCPPIFLANCKDDPIVDYHNSELLDSALTANRIPHIYLQYSAGGHGFGASEEKGTAECREWKNEFLKWIQDPYKRQ